MVANKQAKHYVVGLGEVGNPLLENIKEYSPVYGIDLDTPKPESACDVMHICIGMKNSSFINTAVDYIKTYKPIVAIIHSTVVPGTCRKIAEQVDCHVAHSPIRGKHINMKADQRRYSKFVAGVTDKAGELAEQYLKDIGFNTRRMSSTETTEFSKISSTSYFGLLIAWAQELERYADQLDIDYDEITQIYEEIPYFPDTKFFPGVIGGHCVMPNIELLKQIGTGPMVDAIERSNNLKIKREQE